jgi:tryptophanyl-tRNA synthetase
MMREFMHSQKLKVEDVKKFTKQNAADIIAVGFDMKRRSSSAILTTLAGLSMRTCAEWRSK